MQTLLGGGQVINNCFISLYAMWFVNSKFLSFFIKDAFIVQECNCIINQRFEVASNSSVLQSVLSSVRTDYMRHMIQLVSQISCHISQFYDLHRKILYIFVAEEEGTFAHSPFKGGNHYPPPKWVTCVHGWGKFVQTQLSF